ncbi:MAG: hypothetical protein RL065_298 [Bacteroidota bacterium]|jgi:glycerol-3-phosphate acyltransferase PlsY
MKNKIFLIALFIIVATLFVTEVNAQCAMCGEAARTSLKEGNTTAASLNSGIFYLLMGPYLLLMAGGIAWWRHRSKIRKMQSLNNS